LKEWLTSLDAFRNWLGMGLQPAKADENQTQVRMAAAGAARSNRASGAVEAEQLFDPERA
jgi:hypothetical protein